MDVTYQGPSEVWSGAQTGADRGGLEAALALGLPVGGWAPRGYRSEDGKIPERYARHMREHPSAAYPHRTEANVGETCATLVLAPHGRADGGTGLTVQLAKRRGKPCLVVDPYAADAPAAIVAWLVEHRPRRLNVAGPRESRAPGIERQSAAAVFSALSAFHTLSSGRIVTAHDTEQRNEGTNMFPNQNQNPFAQVSAQIAPGVPSNPAPAVPPAQAPAMGFGGGGAPVHAPAPAGYNPYGDAATTKASAGGRSKDYLDEGMFILQVNNAKNKTTEGVMRHIVEGIVVFSSGSQKHFPGSSWSWMAKCSSKDMPDIKGFTGACLGLNPLTQLETISAITSPNVILDSITPRADKRNPLAFLRAAYQGGIQDAEALHQAFMQSYPIGPEFPDSPVYVAVKTYYKRSDKADPTKVTFTAHPWRAVPDDAIAAAQQTGWTEDVVRRLCA